jgi:transcriptional regulator with XRE-family HTH domain
MAARTTKKTRVGIAFGAALRQERAAQHLSQERLAELSNLGAIYVSNVERGLYQPTVGSVLSFERALGLQPGELVRRTGQSLGPSDRRKKKTS